MKITIDILLVLACLVILVQDLHNRMISVMVLAGTGILLGTTFILYNRFENERELLLVNYLFILAQLGFLYFYFTRIRKLSAVFFEQVMGWGDIIMILCMGLAFPLPQLIIYLVVSYLAGIVYAVTARNKTTAVTIPLAGIMAAVYVLNLTVFYCTGLNLIQPFTA